MLRKFAMCHKTGMSIYAEGGTLGLDDLGEIDGLVGSIIEILPSDNEDNYIQADYATKKYVHIGVKENLGRYTRIATIAITSGIKARIGVYFNKKKGKRVSEVLNYLFDRAKGWTLRRAMNWVKRHRRGAVKGSIEGVYSPVYRYVYEKGNILVTEDGEVFASGEFSDKPDGIFERLMEDSILTPEQVGKIEKIGHGGDVEA